MIEPIEEIFSSINFVDPLPPNSPFPYIFLFNSIPMICVRLSEHWGGGESQQSFHLFPVKEIMSDTQGQTRQPCSQVAEAFPTALTFTIQWVKKEIFRKRKSYPASLHFMERKINVDTLCVIKLCVIRNYYSLDWHLHIKGYEEKKNTCQIVCTWWLMEFSEIGLL